MAKSRSSNVESTGCRTCGTVRNLTSVRVPGTSTSLILCRGCRSEWYAAGQPDPTKTETKESP